jgi:opacity protein-like surface antigen
MKNHFLKVLCSLMILWVVSNYQLSAQTYSFGIAGIYGDDIDNFGVNTRVYINNNKHNMCIGPEFSYFFEETREFGDETEKINLYEININGHYVVELIPNLGFYGLTGVNYSREQEEIFHLGELEEEIITRRWGWNLGAGVHYQFNHQWIIFTEYDHLFSDLSQNSVALGAFFTFGKGFRVGGHTPEHGSPHHHSEE